MVGVRNRLRISSALGKIRISGYRMFAWAQIGSKQFGLLLGQASIRYVSLVMSKLHKTQEWWDPILNLEKPVLERAGSPSETLRPNPRYEQIRVVSEVVAVALSAVAGWYSVRWLHPLSVRLLGLAIGALIAYLAARVLLFAIQCGMMHFIVLAAETLITLVVSTCLCLWLHPGAVAALLTFVGAWPATSAYLLPLLLLLQRKLASSMSKRFLATLDWMDDWANRHLPESDSAPLLKPKKPAQPILANISWTQVIVAAAVLIAVAGTILPMQSMPWGLVSLVSAFLVLISPAVCRSMSRCRPFLVVWGEITYWLMLDPL